MTNIPILEGYGCKLRPVDIGDAAFIVTLRNQPFAKGTIHDTSTSVQKQIAWIQNWQMRTHDYYWIIETRGDHGTPIGTIGFYDIDLELNEGMPGRWVMMPQSQINIMAPFVLMYAFVFDQLNVSRVIMDVVASNRKVRRFHELYGAKYISPPARYVGTEEEVGVPLVWFQFSKEDWPSMFEYWRPILESYW